ncbi:MAG TPA: FAD/NAD(P)-binding protein [Pirellulales bacterium]|nr:FAD/NAD(P)-binding protein [Pirellulales bacterium]
MTSPVALPPVVANPWLADAVVIREMVAEGPGVTTFRLAFVDEERRDSFRFRPGQFGMLYLPGVGEVPIGISGHCQQERTWSFTVRAAGNTTRALSSLHVGDTLGLRGPFGSAWPLELCDGADLVIVAGGLGLPPLRPVIYDVIANRERYGRVTLIYGSRTVDALVYASEYDDWSRRGIDVQTTVDRADLDWKGNVGVVPLLIERLHPFVHDRAILFTCGPEVMIRFAVRSALARGMRIEQIWASMERNMQCAIGLCGHCQFGPEFICKDGPVFRYDRVEPWLKVEAL